MKDKHPIIFGDRDTAGQKSAKHLARLALAAGAASVKIVAIPETWGKWNDLKDPLPTGVTADDLRKLLDEAQPFARIIRVHAGKQHEQSAQGIEALADSGGEIYQHGGRLVRPAWIECEAATVREADGTISKRKTKAVVLVAVDCPYLCKMLSATAEWWKPKPKKNDDDETKFIRCNPPKDVAAMILSSKGDWTALPTIAGVISAPTLRPDGSILSEAGFDAATGLYHMRDQSLVLPPIPENPTKDDAKAALATLDSLLEEVKFVGGVGGVNHSVARSGFMTPVLRPLMDVAPMHGVTAPAFGSGKSFLVDLVSAVLCGYKCPVIGNTQTKEELDKKIATSLIAGQQLISIDNVSDVLGGDLIAQAVTATVMLVRIMGKNDDQRRIQNVFSFFATGCNLQVRDDLVRRTLICSIDRKEERPELHVYKRDPFRDIMNDRGRYIAAILTIVKAYIAAGRPKNENADPMNNFEIWDQLVRQPLLWLGCEDPIKSMEASRRNDPELAMRDELIEALGRAFGGEREFKTADIIRLANERLPLPENQSADGYRPFANLELREAVVAACAGKLDKQKLGIYLAKMKGQMIEGAWIEKVEEDDDNKKPKVATWRVRGFSWDGVRIGAKP